MKTLKELIDMLNMIAAGNEDREVYLEGCNGYMLPWDGLVLDEWDDGDDYTEIIMLMRKGQPCA